MRKHCNLVLSNEGWICISHLPLHAFPISCCTVGYGEPISEQGRSRKRRRRLRRVANAAAAAAQTYDQEGESGSHSGALQGLDPCAFKVWAFLICRPWKLWIVLLLLRFSAFCTTYLSIFRELDPPVLSLTILDVLRLQQWEGRSSSGMQKLR